jgi:hypothetical protein
VHIVTFRIGVNCSVNMSGVDVPGFDGGVQRSGHYLLLRVAKLSRSDQILMSCEHVLRLN